MLNIKLGGLGINTEWGCEQRGLIDLVEFCVKEFGLDILAGPEWMFLPEKKVYNKEEKNDIIKKISQKTKGTNCLILPGTIVWQEDGLVSNTAPIIADGELIEEYSKWSDGGTFCIATHLGFDTQDHTKKGTSFTWEGLDIGLEICSDHNIKKSIKNNPKIKKLDLQIVLASGGELVDHYLKLKENGYGFFCDGDGFVRAFDGNIGYIAEQHIPLTRLKTKQESTLLEQQPVKSEQIEKPTACKIDIYDAQFERGK